MRFFSFSSIVFQTPEYIFGNIAFIVLFIAVLLYWFDFSDPSESNVLQSKKSFFAFTVDKNWKNFCMIGANLSLALLLVVRWFESGHFPLSNLYESLIGLSWGFTTVHLVVALDITSFLPSLNLATTDTFNFSQPNVSSEVPSSQHLLGESSTDPSYFTGSAAQTEQAGALLSSCYLQSISVASKANSSNTVQPLDYKSSQFYKTPQPYLQLSDKIGAITAPTALLTSVFATFFLPPEMIRASALIPALKSNWLTMHVTVMVASYAFLLVGSLLSIAFCVYRFIIVKKANKKTLIPFLLTKYSNTSLNQEETGAFNNYKQNQFTSLVNKDKDKDKDEEIEKVTSIYLLASKSKTSPKLSKTQQNNTSQVLEGDVKEVCIWLNTMSYRILGLGFPLLTIGILSGAVWANEAWGSYWSWDPKETWALITWLVFAVYFHSRYTRNSDTSPVPASIASVGFVAIWICYLGVNLLGTGLHSYGWFVY